MQTNLSSSKKRRYNRLFTLCAISGVLACQSPKPKPIGEEDRGNDSSWMVNKADANSSDYSPLGRIAVADVSTLQQAWTVTINDLPKDAKPGKSECISIIVDGIMSASFAKQLAYALDVATGEQLWSFYRLTGRIIKAC